MDNILSLIKQACKQIVKDGEVPCQSEPQQQNAVRSDSECQDQIYGIQLPFYQNLIQAHLQSVKPTHSTIPPIDKQPIVVIEEEQSSSHQHIEKSYIPKPQYTPQKKQDEIKKAESDLKTALKVNQSKAKTKSTIQSAKKAQLNKQVLSKVNINELKYKLNLTSKPQTVPTKPQSTLPKSSPQKPRLEEPSKNINFTMQTNSLSKFPPLKIPQNNDFLAELAARGKVAKKGGKSDRSTKPQNSLQSNIPRFLQRRGRKEGEAMDLGVLSLDELVGQCHLKKIITEQFYIEYIANSTEEHISQFINLFIKNQLKRWDFTRIKITIMDHRRLAEYLVRIFPNQYKICTPDALNLNVKEFLDNLYALPSIKYKKLLDSLDAESKVVQWKTLSIRYQKYANVPVKIHPILPTPTPQTQAKKTMTNGSNSRFLQVKPQKQLGRVQGQGKRSLNLHYNEDNYDYLQFEEDNDKKFIALKHQLKKKKVA